MGHRPISLHENYARSALECGGHAAAMEHMTDQKRGGPLLLRHGGGMAAAWSFYICHHSQDGHATWRGLPAWVGRKPYP
jgi:hypothetical protein